MRWVESTGHPGNYDINTSASSDPCCPDSPKCVLVTRQPFLFASEIGQALILFRFHYSLGQEAAFPWPTARKPLGNRRR